MYHMYMYMYVCIPSRTNQGRECTVLIREVPSLEGNLKMYMYIHLLC